MAKKIMEKKISRKSLKINMFLNVCRSVIGLVIPLIVFPYVSRVLGAESIGRVSFVSSVISYFVLLAGLGIKTYAVSVGAKYRDNPMELKKFCDSVFSINLLATILSVCLMFTLVLVVPKFRSELLIFLILSLNIILPTLGVDWINSIYEDYLFITVSSIVSQMLQLILLFLLVRTSNDVIQYAIATYFGANMVYVFSFFHARKYCKIAYTKRLDLNYHIKPVLLLFATQAMITIFVTSDITILGFLCGNRVVGVYYVSVKIYTIVKTFIAAVVAVSIPRLANQFGNNQLEEFKITARSVYETVITLSMPAVLGLFLLRREIIELVSGSEFLEASGSLALLSIALFFCIGAYFWGQAILVPVRKEKALFFITAICAITNILLNFVLIPYYAEKCAAFTTLLAEVISFVLTMILGKRVVKLGSFGKIYGKVACGCLGIVVVFCFLKCCALNSILFTVLMILTSVLVYFGIEILTRNETVLDIFRGIKNKIRKGVKK